MAIFGASMGIRTERARDREIKKIEKIYTICMLTYLHKHH